ncbi:probable glycosyltransferase At3g07620 isoform X1 [Oryza sativa Japonica Group]|uniref:probable glycosyltransferase At3g07620 isoform X1 n=1 Tax=Oryza sativa subsp. japonica TaxID=39947 RepID=UPI000E1BA98C|nr:probable glycosyltransferase At3g07620 isoform X1 [Oryza sativa Japonica Group]
MPSPLPCNLLTRRRALTACAAVAALTAAAALFLLATPPTEDPTHPYLLASLLHNNTSNQPDSAAASQPPLPSTSILQLQTNLPSGFTTVPSMFLVPSPSPAENLDDGSMEETDPPDLKENPPAESAPFLQEPISSGSPIRRSDIYNKGHDMKDHAMLPPRPEQVPIPLWSTAADEELIYAKKEITIAPLVSNDPDLHAPLFRNVSVFRRSYELMERLLKVFVYHDGAKPIFHSPELKGIYASEGWFMKLMEGNQHFVVRDPNRAHLFYLPYSSRQLEHNLYVPGSNTIEPLSIFVKKYIDFISTKFPYWNRTKGADHFFVACHDWGPYTTKLHDELRKNTIKALCNADLSEGVFIHGRDVSLPETFLRSPRRPLRGIGGKPAAERSILAFFAGQMHGRVRPVLLQYWGGKDADMRIYDRLPHRITRRMNYIQHMKSSKYCICPMGYEVNSPRIVEAIYYECVPVIIADNFVLPFDDALNWSAFSVVIPEKDVPKLKQILLAIPDDQYMAMQSNVQRVQKHFIWHPNPIKYDIFHMILHSIWYSRVNQIQIE